MMNLLAKIPIYNILYNSDQEAGGVAGINRGIRYILRMGGLRVRGCGARGDGLERIDGKFQKGPVLKS